MYIRKHTRRFVLLFLSFIIALLIFQAKLVWIQFFRSANFLRLAEKQHDLLVHLEPKRGGIYDRNGRPLALNTPTRSLYAQPRLMKEADIDAAVRELPGILGVGRDFISSRLNRDKYFVWIARKLSDEQADKVEAFKIPGLGFRKESKRHYPNQFLAAHIIGFAGIDNQGLEGLELQFDRLLQGQPGFSQIIRDARLTQLQIERNFVPPKNGFDIFLTIDETIQYIAERALDEAFRKHRAKGAIIAIMEPKTGKILALANRPTVDLYHFSESEVSARRNRAVSDMYEPGSVFKIVTAAAALEEGGMSEKDTFYCEHGKYRVANHTLRDHTPHGTLTLSEVFEKSSNIGVTKIAQKLGPATIYKYGRLFRFGMPTGIDLPGEVVGILKPPREWSGTSISAIPMGHEVAVTAIQLLSAISAIANDGIYMRPFVVQYIKDEHGELIREFHPTEVVRVMSPEIARRVTVILEKAVEKGTGTRAKIQGVRVAGKTGTAQKIVDGAYVHNRFYASFIGFAPVDDPQIAMVVIFDEPRPHYFGGTVSAPVFKQVAQDVLRYLDSH